MKRFILILFCFVHVYHLQSQSLLPTQSIYNQGELIQFNYSGGTGSDFDWIGFYQDGEIPGTVSSVEWDYVLNTEGTITFSATLDVGIYDVYFLCCDGYSEIANFENLEIKESRIFSRLKYYKTTDSVILTVNNIKANYLVKIYASSDFIDGVLIPGSVPIQSQIIATGTGTISTARKSFAPITSPNNYTAVIEKPTGAILYQTNFTINSVAAIPSTITRIGVASCGQNSAQPTLENILTRDIDLFIALGDNVYIDTYNESTLINTYEEHLSDRFELQQLRSTIPIIATWDDHDYGCCDEDKDYPIKDQSQEIFLDFWDEPLASPRRTQDGIYTSYYYGPTGQKLQIIVLDTRYFLDNKKSNTGCGINEYCPWNTTADKSKTILGNTQWNWLKNELLIDADLRLIVSSIQFGNSYNGYEQWAEFPYQQKKFTNIIKQNHVDGVFFVSGDVHYSELSKYNTAGVYPIYDFTSSAINQYWIPESNSNRVDDLVYGEPNTGTIDIDWTNEEITFTCIDRFNIDAYTYTVPFAEMSFIAEDEISKQATFESSFTIYPNPASKQTTISFYENRSGVIQIFNLNGENIQTYQIENQELQILEPLSSGFYIIQFEFEHEIWQEKLIVE